ncbi:hypothetical protein FA15DRAFT_661239 [Coprinopsis marcescibilis]|uniref:Uncharacterized protein n=1 Tax=Coprinopsis marcescibilis TaxID=230819 RepID=A0A5C3KD02_COPMA|nr:hypothetical protein FA15DRAFT_661239 [Coprinopsis marcescibilis]
MFDGSCLCAIASVYPSWIRSKVVCVPGVLNGSVSIWHGCLALGDVGVQGTAYVYKTGTQSHMMKLNKLEKTLRIPPERMRELEAKVCMVVGKEYYESISDSDISAFDRSTNCVLGTSNERTPSSVPFKRLQGYKAINKIQSATLGPSLEYFTLTHGSI